jgi:predicted metalloprotease with PDZ domain
MVGRMEKEKLSVLAVRSGREFSKIVDSVNSDFKFDLGKGDSGFGSSDHASFLQMKIPSMFFTTGAHADYHRPSDTAEKINRAGMKRIESFVQQVVQRVDRLDGAPEYDPKSEDLPAPARGGRGYGVYFGSVPEFREVESQEGVPLQGVRAGSPAEVAGLKPSDILTGIGEIKIKNLHDLVFALRFYRANEEVEVTWQRAGKSMRGKTLLKNREEQH